MLTPKFFIALLLTAVICFSYSCKRQHHQVTRGFYYWKTTFNPTVFEMQTLQQLQVQRMYVRFFDVDWDSNTGQTTPVAPIQIRHAIGNDQDVVPVVFITQKTLENIQLNNTVALAEKISAFLQGMCSGAEIHPSEIQIDCDWTAGNSGKYFKLLNELKQQHYFKGKTLSCTIRMHQVKYTGSSGIPPVDRGLLMCYSMGNIKQPGAMNSILDAKTAKNYLKKIHSYPLPLDVALPLFEWCVLFHEEQFRGILHDVTPHEVKSSGLFKLKAGNEYICMHDTTWHGYRLQANDIVRTETPAYDDILSVANYSAQQIFNRDLKVVLFACDSLTLSKYSINELDAVYNCYR